MLLIAINFLIIIFINFHKFLLIFWIAMDEMYILQTTIIIVIVSFTLLVTSSFSNNTMQIIIFTVYLKILNFQILLPVLNFFF